MALDFRWSCFLFLFFNPGVPDAREPILELERCVPRTAADCSASRCQQWNALSEQIEQWAAELTWNQGDIPPPQVLRTIRQLANVKRRVDDCQREVVKLRAVFDGIEPSDARRGMLRHYLTLLSGAIDLSGRLRYLMRDAVENATYVLEPSLPDYGKLIELLIEQRVQIAAEVLAYVLFDPSPESGARPFPDAVKKQVLALMRVVRDPASVDDLAQFVREPDVAAALLMDAAEIIREIGLPQDSRPKSTSAGAPPSITAGQLHSLLAKIAPEQLTRELETRRQRLLAWLDVRATKGIVGDTYRVGSYEVRSGDWLLMRNPSPYNLFTDLSPGLFTHVGVVAAEEGSDGIRRFVIVDLPERGDRIPANNVDRYLTRTLHYFLLRHQDHSVGSRMGRAARDMIGNPSQFDLLFRTNRIDELKGKPLKGKLIHTYCAGLLLLCAQQTGLPRETFFPITEAPAGRRCRDNLKTLGLSIGDDFVSPTGAVFSPHMTVIGECRPMYDPTREIKETIYDHFARRMNQRQLVGSPDMSQMLVEKLARISKSNRWLARALASANNVSENMDLEAAAKTAAVVETLDEIANKNVDEFLQARAAIVSLDLPDTPDDTSSVEQRRTDQQLRDRHSALSRRWQQQELSPLDLRKHLVRYYIQQGMRQLDHRFFPTVQ